MKALAMIRPDEAGADAEDTLWRHATMTRDALGEHSVVLRHFSDAPASPIYRVVQRLCSYAQCGDVTPWSSPEQIDADISTALRMLCSRPISLLWEDGAAWTSTDPLADLSPCGTVVHAAWSRRRIERGEPVAASELSRLASVSPSWVRTQITEEALTATSSRRGVPYMIEAKEARRWLDARGLPGWNERTPT
jgi:hypothetical protein